MPATPYLSIHEGAEVDAAVTDVPILRAEMDRLTDFTLFTGGTAAALDSIVTTALAVGARAFVINGSALYVFVLTAGTDAENSPTVVRPDDFAITTNEKVWKWQAITEAAEITGPGSSVDNGIARWNGTGGTAIQDSPITIDDTGFITVTGATARFLRSTNDNVVSIIGGDSKTNAAFVDFSGDTHATTPGRIGFTTKGTGTFRVVNTPITTLGGTEIFSIGADGSINVSAKATAQVTAFVAAGADAVPYTVSFDKSRNTVASPTIITVADCLGVIRFRGHTGSTGYITSAQIRADSTGTVGPNNTARVPSSLIFSTATDAAPSVLTDAMTIGNLQTVGLGTAPTASRLTINSVGDHIKFVGAGVTDAFMGAVGLLFVLGNYGSTIGRLNINMSTGNISLGPSTTPSANLDINNGTTATNVYIYETVVAAASPIDYARISITTTASSNSRIFTEAGGTGLISSQPRILQVGTGPSVGLNIAGQNSIWDAGQGTGSGLGGSHLFRVAAAGGSGSGNNALTTAMTIDGSGNVGIGTAPSIYRLDIVGPAPSTAAQIRLADNSTNNTVKSAAITARHYANASADFLGLLFVAGTVNNQINFGGGHAGHNCATQIAFYAGPTTTSGLGTLQLYCKGDSGFLGVGPSIFPSAKLDVNDLTTTTAIHCYHTRDALSSPTDFSRLTLSHSAAGAGNQKANILAETGGTGEDNIDIRLAPAGTGSVFLNVGVPLSMSSGSNQRAGNATLVAGTVTVSNTTVTANTIVVVTRKTSGGTIGTAITYTLSAGTSFTVTSDSVLDTSTFSYLLIEVP